MKFYYNYIIYNLSLYKLQDLRKILISLYFYLFTQVFNSYICVVMTNNHFYNLFSLRLFSLLHLEELDISYNSIAFIPNEIQKLRYFGSSK